MRRFKRRIEEITWNIANYPATTRIAYPKNSFTYGIHTEKVNWFLGTPERIAELQGLVSEAQRLATTPLEQRRLQWFTDHIWGQAVEGRKAFENREKARAVPIPQVTLGYAGECEGVLEKVDFSEAARSGGWALLDNSELAAKPELALASDSRYLYLRYREAGDVAWKHRDADLWANGVEIFLAAQPDYPFSHLVLAPNGEFKALRHVVIEGVVKMQDWPLKPVIANQLDENGWTFALAVPLAQLLPDRAAVPGDRIYANFMRTRLFDRQASWAWSPIFADTYVHGLYRMGQIYLAPTLQEGLLPVNGELTAAAGALPDGWVHNHLGKDTPPGRVAADKGRVSLVSTGDPVELYHRKVFPARRGDRIVFEFTASGKGTGAVGAYFCTGAADGAGRGFEQFAVTGEPRQFKIAVTVTNPNPARFTNGFHPVLAATPGAQVEVSGLKMQVVPR